MITSMRTPFLSISASILAQKAIRNRRFAGSRHVLSHHWYPFGHMNAPNEGSIPGDPFTFSIFAAFLVPAGHPKSIQNRTFGGQGGPRLTFYSRILAHSQIVNEFSLILTQKWQKKQRFFDRFFERLRTLFENPQTLKIVKIVVFPKENNGFQEFAFFAFVILFATKHQKLRRKLDRWKILKKSYSEAPLSGSNESK